ncbi:RNA-directed DNA polymerase, eukaryota, reverse transcriptase zinc-binding domain protein [Tanacetum coccineum]
MSQTAFRLANYIIEKEEFGDIVKAGWTKSCDGHDMFKLVNKLKKELLRGYNSKNGPKRCYLKIDIQKAYDIVSWSFLEEILHNYGFPESMIKWIMKFHGATSDGVKMDRDEASLFNKIDAGEAECMSKEVTEAEIKKALFDIEDNKAPGPNGLKAYDTVSWSFLEEILHNYGFPESTIKYDLLMLCHGDSISISTIKRGLEKFSKVSGLHPNMNKSTMFCGSLSEEEKEVFLNILPFKIGRLLVRYLNVPLMDKKIRVKDCKSLVDKVRQKLCDWKNKSLSYAGINQLIASVLSSNASLLGLVENHIRYKVGNGKTISAWWKWHNEWMNTHSFLLNIPIHTLVDEPDRALWVTNQGNMVKFITKQVGTDIRGDGDKVK